MLGVVAGTQPLAVPRPYPVHWTRISQRDFGTGKAEQRRDGTSTERAQEAHVRYLPNLLSLARIGATLPIVVLVLLTGTLGPP